MTFASIFDGERLHDGRDPEENEEEIRENILVISRKDPLIGRTLDMIMSHSNMGDDMTFYTGYDDAVTLITRSRKDLELDLRQCVEEVAGNISEYETYELKKGVDRALERHEKAIDRLFVLLHRLEKRDENRSEDKDENEEEDQNEDDTE